MPFDTYDFFGYLIPGFFFFLLYLSFEFYVLDSLRSQYVSQANLIKTPLLNFVRYLFDNKFDWTIYASIIVSGIIVCYATAHAIAAASSLFIDRMLVSKIYGYPTETLVPTEDGRGRLEQSNRFQSVSARFYMAFFTWINIYLLVRAVELIVPGAVPVILLPVLEWLIVTICCAKITFSLICHHLSESTKKGRFWVFIDAAAKWSFTILAIPYFVSGMLISKYLQTRRGFGDDFVREFNVLYSEQMWTCTSSKDSNRFWMPFLYVSHHAPSLGAMIMHWLHLYSFARNLATACYLSFLAMVISVALHKHEISNLAEPIVAITLLFTVFLLSVGMLIRYYYLYYCYYSKFTLRAFVFLARAKNTGTVVHASQLANP